MSGKQDSGPASEPAGKTEMPRSTDGNEEATVIASASGATDFSSATQATNFGAAAVGTKASLPSIGDVLGPYIIERKLGEGGMGCVYVGHHRENQEEIRAIKVVSPDMAGDSFVGETFVREARVLSRMTPHEALVHYYFFDRRPDGLVYIVMEFVKGSPLTDYIKEKGKLSVQEVRALMERCASGLSVLHQKKIVHRDLKPDNIILQDGRPDHAKIVDFGIAKASELGKTIVEQGGFIGTPHYASPEQLFGRLIDERSDIYSLGLVLFHAATGRSARAGLAPHEVLRASEKLPDLSAVPKELRDDIAKMLQPDPRDRPSSMDELLGQGKKGGGKLTPVRMAIAAGVALVLIGAVVAGLTMFSPKGTSVAVAPPPQPAPVTPQSAPAAPSVNQVQPPAPAGPVQSAAAVADAITRQLGDFDCARLAAAADGDRIVLNGFVRSAADRARALSVAEHAADRPVSAQVDVVEPPFCAVRQETDGLAAFGKPQIQASHPDGRYVEGDLISFTVTPPPGITQGWMSVILVDAGGNIAQMLPLASDKGLLRDGRLTSNQPIRIGGRGDWPIELVASPPDGPMMILAIYSDRPLGLTADANENVDSFIRQLRVATASRTQTISDAPATVSAYDMIEVVKP